MWVRGGQKRIQVDVHGLWNGIEAVLLSKWLPFKIRMRGKAPWRWSWVSAFGRLRWKLLHSPKDSTWHVNIKWRDGQKPNLITEVVLTIISFFSSSHSLGRALIQTGCFYPPEGAKHFPVSFTAVWKIWSNAVHWTIFSAMCKDTAIGR